MEPLYDLIIIEDEDEIRAGLENVIDWNSLGFCVAASFASGEEALAYLPGSSCRAILTDICLGGVSGLDVAYWVHKNAPDTHVVLLSGYSDFGYAQRSIECKVSRYLLKPVDIGELRSTFQDLYREIRTKDQNQKRNEGPQAGKRSGNIDMEALIRCINRFEFDLLLKELADMDLGTMKALGYILLARYIQLTEHLSDAADRKNMGFPESEISEAEGEEALKQGIEHLVSLFSSAISRNASDVVEKACSYIHSAGGRKVTLNEVSEHVFVSPAYLSKEFKRQLNINFKKYVSNESIRCAKELLSNTNVRVCDIAEQLGFRDVRNFYKFFSEATGQTPTEYRTQFRKGS